MSLYTRLSRLLTRSLLGEPGFCPSSSSPCFTLGKSFIIQQVPRRHLNVIRDKPFAGKKVLEDLHKKDGMPRSFTLVYRTNFPNYFLCGQIFVFLSLGAFATVGIASLVQYQLGISKEEIDETLKKRKEAEVVIEKQTALDKQVKLDKIMKTSVATSEEVPLPSPQLSDLVEYDLDIFFIFCGSLVILASALYRILRVMPVRIYIGKKKHCVGVFHGSIIPGRKVHQDFVAGTVHRRKTQFRGIWGESLFKDGSGHDMVLLEQFFRHQADFHYILGLRKDDDYQVADGQEMEQYKESGSLAVKGYDRPQNDTASKGKKTL